MTIVVLFKCLMRPKVVVVSLASVRGGSLFSLRFFCTYAMGGNCRNIRNDSHERFSGRTVTSLFFWPLYQQLCLMLEEDAEKCFHFSFRMAGFVAGKVWPKAICQARVSNPTRQRQFWTQQVHLLLSGRDFHLSTWGPMGLLYTVFTAPTMTTWQQYKIDCFTKFCGKLSQA